MKLEHMLEEPQEPSLDELGERYLGSIGMERDSQGIWRIKPKVVEVDLDLLGEEDLYPTPVGILHRDNYMEWLRRTRGD